MDVKSKLPTNCKILLTLVGYVDESMMISFLAVYEFYNIHKNIGMLLRKIATSTFSVSGCFLHFFLLGKVNLAFTGEQEWARYFSWVGNAPYAPSWLWLITRQYFPCEDCSMSLVTTCFHFILVASCVYWLLSFQYVREK